jgi:hypothetical protein
MARTALTVQTLSDVGIEPAYAAANAAGNMFPNTGRSILHVVNGGGASIDVTVQSALQVSGLDLADLTVAVPAGEERMIGRLPVRTFNRASGVTDPNQVYVDYSDVTSLTVALFEP